MRAVIEEEMQQIKNKLAEDKRDYKEIIYVVVQKRIDARFFTENGRNVESGTLVDQGVVASEEVHKKLGTDYDFFLVGQSHMQGNIEAKGTMNPVHYWVKHYKHNAEYQTTPAELHRLTYRLCHLYYNWTGTVSGPALCKYAKVLASMAGKTMGNRDLNPRIQHLLPYL